MVPYFSSRHTLYRTNSTGSRALTGAVNSMCLGAVSVQTTNMLLVLDSPVSLCARFAA
jgi:hypothetical protein